MPVPFEDCEHEDMRHEDERSDPSLPSGAEIDWCGDCGGTWRSGRLAWPPR